MWQFWSFVVTDGLITEGRGFGETEQIIKTQVLWMETLGPSLLNEEQLELKKSHYMMGSTWYWVCTQVGSCSAIFFSPLSLEITLDFEKLSHVAPELTSLPSLKAERSHGDGCFSKAVASSWASNSASPAGFCFLERASCAVCWQFRLQTKHLFNRSFLLSLQTWWQQDSKCKLKHY